MIFEEYTLPNGELFTLEQLATGFEVASWKADGELHWARRFSTEEAARKEFERFRYIQGRA